MEIRVKQIHSFGQSIWLDFIARSIIKSGELKQLIDVDGVRGVTSNPAIFEKAITSSSDYDADIAELSDKTDDNEEIFLVSPSKISRLPPTCSKAFTTNRKAR